MAGIGNPQGEYSVYPSLRYAVEHFRGLKEDDNRGEIKRRFKKPLGGLKVITRLNLVVLIIILYISITKNTEESAI